MNESKLKFSSFYDLNSSEMNLDDLSNTDAIILKKMEKSSSSAFSLNETINIGKEELFKLKEMNYFTLKNKNFESNILKSQAVELTLFNEPFVIYSKNNLIPRDFNSDQYRNLLSFTHQKRECEEWNYNSAVPAEDTNATAEYISLGNLKHNCSKETLKGTEEGVPNDKIEILMKRIEEKTQNSLKKISELTAESLDCGFKNGNDQLSGHPHISAFNEVEEEVEVFDATSVHDISFKKELKHFFESNSTNSSYNTRGAINMSEHSITEQKRGKSVFEPSQPSLNSNSITSDNKSSKVLQGSEDLLNGLEFKRANKNKIMTEEKLEAALKKEAQTYPNPDFLMKEQNPEGQKAHNGTNIAKMIPSNKALEAKDELINYIKKDTEEEEAEEEDEDEEGGDENENEDQEDEEDNEEEASRERKERPEEGEEESEPEEVSENEDPNNNLHKMIEYYKKENEILRSLKTGMNDKVLALQRYKEEQDKQIDKMKGELVEAKNKIMKRDEDVESMKAEIANMHEVIQKLLYSKKGEETEKETPSRKNEDPKKALPGNKEGLREKSLNKNVSSSKLTATNPTLPANTKVCEKKANPSISSSPLNVKPHLASASSNSVKNNKENKCTGEKVTNLLGTSNFWNEELESLKKIPEAAMSSMSSSKQKSSPREKKKVKLPFNFPRELSYSNYQVLAQMLSTNE